VLILIALAGVVLVLTAIAARAHSWYDLECCSGRDCAPVSAKHVSATPNGWLVELAQGDHPMMGPDREPLTVLIPYDDGKVRRSRDSDFHACVRPYMAGLYCLYIPEMGS